MLILKRGFWIDLRKRVVNESFDKYFESESCPDGKNLYPRTAFTWIKQEKVKNVFFFHFLIQYAFTSISFFIKPDHMTLAQNLGSYAVVRNLIKLFPRNTRKIL